MLAWLVFGAYAVATFALALKGMGKTRGLSGFALGNGDIGPAMAGIALAAAIASTATFVINPGFVYAHGVSGLFHLGVATYAGVIAALVLLSRGFRRYGAGGRALTLPQWAEARYGHRGLRTYFALLNLVLAVAFVVLIVKGSALIMTQVLGLSYVAAVVVVIGLVFSYVMIGGTYAHVYTNSLQGVMMVLVAIAVVASGLHLFADGVGPFLSRLAAEDPNLIMAVNPESPLFGSVFEVFVCGFIVGAALTAQPHILTKSLYLSDDGKLRRYFWFAGGVCVVYAAVLVAGLYARVLHPGIESQDAVMAVYLTDAFSPWFGTFVSVALLAAGMSTMDGILVSASSIAANDIFARLPRFQRLDRETRERRTLSLSRVVLGALALVSFALALDPPELVGLFAQAGIYGLVAASFAPIAVGVLSRSFNAGDACWAAAIGPAVHFFLYFGGDFIGAAIANPAVSATLGILLSFAVVLLRAGWRSLRPLLSTVRGPVRSGARLGRRHPVADEVHRVRQ